jgi:hypothetical protein
MIDCTTSSIDLGKKYDFSPHDLRSYETKIRKIYVSVKNVEDLDFLRQNLCVIVLQKNSLKGL